ncbi:GntR family transcriptional regulator [Azorhizobium oxalatiphilum]|uniref:GntR family transcriptional regulator n=1 Tax=Azorhizobium oxalatiphilum TaxID=980631 RepID=A0A917BNZ7_9HYPH|nr:PLP-dependent aminotransferase family protein [Azorhizobium oxalatiphilum]GGF48484.1 GntR family transcriptional regulator [Azorhizobium oxalatiphilum]
MLQIVVDASAKVPLVTQIVSAVSARIAEGALPSGSRLPSVRQLAALCGVSTLTVSNAYNRLVAEGLLEARRASGYYVAARKASREPQRRALPGSVSIDALWLLQRVYEDDPTLLKVGAGWLPESHLFTDGLRHALAALAKKPGAAVSRYGNPLGYAPLRRAIQMLLTQRAIDCEPDHIILTHGASQALDIAARALLQPGDTAFVDDPGYCNLFPTLRQLGVKIVGIPRTTQGPDVEALEALARQHRPRVFFTNTVLHNPTGTGCAPSVIYRVLRVAEDFDFHIVEDDIFAGMAPEQVPNIASLDQFRRVLYVGSFSKTVSPALRVGYLVVGRDLVERMLYLKLSGGLTSSEITEQAAHAILTEGHHRLHLARLRDKLAAAQKAVCDNLENAGLSVFHRPSGGMFVWAALPGQPDMAEVAQRALEEGIMLAPGALFKADQKPTPFMRFNVTYADHARLYRFLERASGSMVQNTA